MPISQDRMLRLLQAAEKCLTHIISLRVAMREKKQSLKAGHITIDTLIEEMTWVLEDNSYITNAIVAIREERIHINYTYNRNIKEKNAQFNRRRREGRKIQAVPSAEHKAQQPYLLGAESPLTSEYAATLAARITTGIETQDPLTKSLKEDTSKPQVITDEAAKQELEEVAERVKRARELQDNPPQLKPFQVNEEGIVVSLDITPEEDEEE